MDENRKNNLESFLNQLNIKLKNIELFDLAFCHKSFAYENGNLVNNERIEFLGDAILSLIISEELYNCHPELSEGKLSKIRSQLVSRRMLAHKAKILHLDEILKLGKGEEHTGGRNRVSILAGVFEALIGAIYLDSGIETIREFIITNIINTEKELFEGNIIGDYKSDLQEVAQRKYQTIPNYKIVSETGPDHHKEFIAEVYINNELMGVGSGKSKKQAEINAAKIAIQKLTSQNESQE